MTNVEIPKGVHYVNPAEASFKEHITKTIKDTFELFGFESFQSPALFFQKNLTENSGEEILSEMYAFTIRQHKLAMKFDQTIPLAIYLANNPQVPLPFKRMDYDRVWRWGSTGEGRSREFFQFDIDTVGSHHMHAEAEIIAAANQALVNVGIRNHRIHINNRKLINDLISYSLKSEKDALFDVSKDTLLDASSDVSTRISANTPQVITEKFQTKIIQTLDKLDKIGVKAVKKELLELNLSSNFVDSLLELMLIEGTNQQKLEKLETVLLPNNEGLNELKRLIKNLKSYPGLGEKIIFSPSVARGLLYYTGPVFETIIQDMESLGSVCSGGRYDDLIGTYIGSNVPATGISIGVDRIISALQTLNSMKRQQKQRTFVANIGTKMLPKSIEIAENLRQKGIIAHVNLMNWNLKKQIEHAVKLQVRKMVLVGERELELKSVIVRNLEETIPEKKQLTVRVDEIENQF